MALILVSPACSDGGVFSGGGKSDVAASPPADGAGATGGTAQTGTSPQIPGDELATPPQIIAGTFLHDVYIACADSTVEGARNNELVVGCSVTDRSSGLPVPLGAFATEWNWHVTPTLSIGGVQVRILEPAEAEFQAYLLFSGVTGDRLRHAADFATVHVDVKVKPEAGAAVTGFSNRIKEAKEQGVYAPPPPPPLEQQVNLEPLDPTIDMDGDGVPDTEDRCNATPRGAKVWTDGDVRGCATDDLQNSDDADLDRVANAYDRCGNTKYGEPVETAVGNRRRGCSATQSPGGSVYVDPP